MPVGPDASREDQTWIDLINAFLELGEISKDVFPPLVEVASKLHEHFGNLEVSVPDVYNFQTGYSQPAFIEGESAELHYPSAYGGNNVREVRECGECDPKQLNDIIQHKDQYLVDQPTQPTNGPDDLLRCYHVIGTLLSELENNADKASQNLCRERLRPVEAASYNSPQSVELGRGSRVEGTRMEALAHVRDWTYANEPKAYWMQGMVGTGKTTIAYTICDELHTRGQLAASFFCSRLLPECRDVRQVIPTIAYRLAQLSLPFRYQLCLTLTSDQSLDSLEPAIQFQKLIKEPIMAIKDVFPDHHIIVIDGLDELEDTFGIQTTLKLILGSAAEIPVKLLITSRPDLRLPDTITSKDARAPPVYLLYAIDGEIFGAEPGHRAHGAERLNGNSISSTEATQEHQLQGLRVDHRRQPTKPLTLTTNSHNSYQRQMDGLYTSALKEVFEDPNRNAEELKLIKLVLWSAVYIQEPLAMASLARLLRLNDDQRAILTSEPLEAVLYTPVGTELITAPPASFADYIFSERSAEFTHEKSTYHGLLAQRCFELMHDQLGFNLCDQQSSTSRDCDVHSLDKKVNALISGELFYACRCWGIQVGMSAPSPSLITHLRWFISHQLLAWLEVLNLKQAVSLGEPMLAATEAWLHENDVSSDITLLVRDAREFVATLAAIPPRSSTPHIYVSALAIWRSDSPMFQAYGDLIRDIVAIDGITVNFTSLYTYDIPELVSIGNNGSSSCLAAIQPNCTTRPKTQPKGTTDQRTIPRTTVLQQNSSVKTIAVWTDNTSIISASGNLAIAVWDRKTGKGVTGPFYMHSACCRVVAFSPDRRHIATGSNGWEFYIWDVSTGELAAGPFRGHRSWVAAIAFSPDGTRIVSGARDQLILVWDICAPDAPVRTLEGHTGYVLSVVFSPQGTHVVSASTDHTVRVWEIRKETPTSLSLTEHTDCVRSVDVSPDGAYIVSGSDDHTIRIWDMSTGKTVSRPCEDHSDYVLSVKFSPNGRQFVSGSQDCTVRVWDVDTGETVAGPFMAHTSRVNTVIFSTDGAQVISGSDDGTIRIWDVKAQDGVDTYVESVSTNSHATADPSVPGTWKLNPDGWVVDQDEKLLMWIPPVSQYAIRPPPADHIMIPRFDLPISSLLEGRAWKELCRQQEDKSIKHEA
ncbi:hypothetical protein FRC11_008469 [Ceratobasidium sp. 423]|nr:hypothetical protein FRC11_008469 [Ceratobasidium sp. 423]